MTDILKNIVTPSNLIISLSVVGIIMLLFKRSRRSARLIIGICITSYLILGNGIISLWLLGTLEHRYKPIASTAGLQDVKMIVILAGYAERHAGLPLSSEVNFASAYRLIEGLRIAQMMPNTEILLSGGGDVPGIMKELLAAMGLVGRRIVIDNKSGSTLESAENVKELIGGEKFILVTSAGHMHRAIGTFQKVGMNPVPAPTNYMSVKERRFMDYLPSPHHLIYADLAMHEYLGMAWYRLTDKM